jgi:enterochelin esterase-like enzyme
LRRVIYVFAALLLGCCFAACSVKETNARLKSITLHSEALDKDMRINVYLPEGYDGSKAYPVLYFLPDYGGGAAIVFGIYEAGRYADTLTRDGKIKPLIIVSTNMDRSFGINSAGSVKSFETSSGKSFTKGPYEDYIVNDLIPYVDSSFRTVADGSGRYIGGYSMGGFAALHIAFRHPGFFSKAGGHSPSLFVGDFPDKTISDWLYPDEAARAERDPIYLAKDNDLAGLGVFIDTGETDVNAEGCGALYDELHGKGIPAESHLYPGVHSRGYCYTYMDEYLLFYAGIDR